jgi:hypothetical protein
VTVALVYLLVFACGSAGTAGAVLAIWLVSRARMLWTTGGRGGR